MNKITFHLEQSCCGRGLAQRRFMICGNVALVKGLELERARQRWRKSNSYFSEKPNPNRNYPAEKTIELINLLLKGFVSALESSWLIVKSRHSISVNRRSWEVLVNMSECLLSWFRERCSLRIRKKSASLFGNKIFLFCLRSARSPFVLHVSGLIWVKFSINPESSFTVERNFVSSLEQRSLFVKSVNLNPSATLGHVSAVKQTSSAINLGFNFSARHFAQRNCFFMGKRLCSSSLLIAISFTTHRWQ